MIDILRSAVLLSDAELLAQVKTLVTTERDTTARLIAVLAEFDARNCISDRAVRRSSRIARVSFTYPSTRHTAGSRQLARRESFPQSWICWLMAPCISTAVGLLAPHLTDDNHTAVLASARHKSKKDIEHPRRAIAPTAARGGNGSETACAGNDCSVAVTASTPVAATAEPDRLIGEADVMPPRQPSRAEVKPLAPEYYKVQFTASRDTYDKLRLAQDLLRHRHSRAAMSRRFWIGR